MKLRIYIMRPDGTSPDWLAYKASAAGSEIAVGSGKSYGVLATAKALCDSPQFESVEVLFDGFESRVDEANIHFILTGKARQLQQEQA